MKLIKLNAIDSTNVFLKELANTEELESYTIVTAEAQTKGKGQMGSVWETEVGKNLIMSVFVKEIVKDINSIFDLNVVVAVSVIEALHHFCIPKLSIKWPNDIMSYNFKIGGILIENNIKSNGQITSVIGIGLNVNQTNFAHLPKGSSLKVLCDTDFDRTEILYKIIAHLKDNISLLQNDAAAVWQKYFDSLFKKDNPIAFKNSITNQNFMGIIKTVTKEGMLQVIKEDDSIHHFRIKEIQMLY
ncbi:biotin--[acetyl-CoA-carboxylase] ligase [Flavobacterium algicola]|uniref:biotin--[acetyl-CoA-carboxylase] ligase n=1 Tax=Flavobacterium algicola TaxID=556529 RepID=UPI001EFDFD29|nr:biotin--[acetyl-CoA-carboxylase] ligase [Flavobacterium algicola]MCG9793362.1 biotin--[acetyl-CoA-carboxylase] ligase [Flavobacterium algicola]